ncbi:endonuclease/exonuclease/phosphatase family protein [Flavobacterium filum]|uniref:endonuclease/exonuclease/phosphatase family protein n=1 Tax=Flavobacterium filum TaxID=370974 RepID=UPI0023F2B791|nr:endonuclease/exonuclease/phosphatase family protein [Flavobacterium filum]
MKIATWNLERPNKSTKKNKEIIDSLVNVNADILILTETNELINFDDNYNYFHSSKLVENLYKDGERRVSIYSKYNSLGQYETFRNDTSICVKFKTPFGNLAVYGTIIGVYGNRHTSFMQDLNLQIADFEKISKTENLCIAGDFNISFSDNYYYTAEGRNKLNKTFANLNLRNLTENIAQNIDHIVLTKEFVGERLVKFETWNLDKKLSDHIGVAVDIS